MEKVIKWFSGNHVAANFLMLVVLIAGFAAWFKVRKEVFPEIAFDGVIVSVPYPNATPEEVANGVVIPIEEAISDVDGIKRVTSNSDRNVGSLTVEVDTGYSTRNVMSDIQTKVDAIDNFAEEAEEPVFEELIINRQIMSLAISADTDERSLRIYADEVRQGLLAYEAKKPVKLGDKIQTALKGAPVIKKVEFASVRPYEISIEVSEEALKKYQLTLSEVAQAVRSASLDLPSGSVKTEAGEVVVRAVGRRYRGEDFQELVIQSLPDGGELKLSQVAEIIDGFEDAELVSTFNGRKAVVLHVYRVGEQDTLAVARVAREYLDGLEKPEGVQVEVWGDESRVLDARLDLLKNNIGMGLALVLIVLALFLRPSLAVLVALGIPVSFAGGLWLMPDLGVSMNMISAFAFILVLGIVVDDAIVVGENVYTRIQGGEHPREASWRGTHEVGVVVIFGILTTATAFTPMLGLSGVSGKIWPNIPLVVIPVLMFSLLQSKFVLPAHLAMLRPTTTKVSRNPLMRIQRAVAGGLERFIEKIYGPVLSLCLRFRYIVWVGFVALVVVCVAIVQTGWLPFIFFPKVEGEILSAKLEMPLGVPFAETERVVNRLENAVQQLGEEMLDLNGESVVVNVLSTTGQQPFQAGIVPGGPPRESHLGEVTLELKPAKLREVSSDEIKTRWQELVGDIPGVVSLSFRSETAAGGNAIDINLIGSNHDDLVAATRWVTGKLRNDYEGVVDVSDSHRMGREEFLVRELTPKGKSLGFNLGMVMNQVRDAFYGNEVQRLQRGKDEVRVMVRYPKKDRVSLASVEGMKLRSPAGEDVPLLEVVVPEYGRGLAKVKRVDQTGAVSIQADVNTAAGYNANTIIKAFEEDVLNQLAVKFPGVRFRFEGEQSDQRESVGEMKVAFLGALLVMYILMAIPLKSYVQPLIVMSVIPFGMVGAIVGHIVMGLDLSIMSMCGIVALAGVVVNDSLVLVDYVNRHRNEGSGILEAARNAGVRRFRPILLTSLTTFVGLMPMLLEDDVQAKFLIPMAVSLGFGILFATAITLILVPSLYVILEDIRRLLGFFKFGIGKREN